MGGPNTNPGTPETNRAPQTKGTPNIHGGHNNGHPQTNPGHRKGHPWGDHDQS